jgi:hypothetical protein
VRCSFSAYALANAFAIAWTLAAVLQPWVDSAGPGAAELLRRWLPFTLVLAAAGTALVARTLEDGRRRRFLARHFAMYAAVPLMLLLAEPSPERQATALNAVYVALGFAWSAHALEGLWHSIGRLRDRTGALHLAAVVLVPFLALIPYHVAVLPTEADEPHYLVIVQSLLDDHDLDLKNQYDNETYRSFYDAPLPDRHIIHVGPLEYPIRDLGLPIVATLPFALGGRSGVLALLCVIGAALVAQLYLACRDLGIAHRPAVLAVAAAALTHPLLTYTTLVYPELIAALVFVTSARSLRDGRATTLRALVAASACVGVLPWLSTRAWLVAVGVGLVVAYCALRPALALSVRERVVRVAAGAAPFAALVLLAAYVDYRMFGWFMPSAGYYLVSDQQQVLTFAPQLGALGLLFDRVFGLIPHAPIFLISAVGIVPLLRRARTAETAALAFGWLAYFLFIASIAYWWADGSPPSRYLLAALPFLVVLLAAGLERLESLTNSAKLAGAIAWGLAMYSLFIAFGYTVVPSLGYELAANIRGTGSEGSLFPFVGRVFRPDPGVFFPSIVDSNARDIAMGAAWMALVIACGVLGWLGTRRVGARGASLR